MVITKESIERNLRVDHNSIEGIDENCYTKEGDFYICTKIHNIWGDYERVSKPSTIYQALSLVGYDYIYFPENCPESWLNIYNQKSTFAVLTMGCNTPFGFCSGITKYRGLEKAMDCIEERIPNLKPPMHYGTNEMYLGIKIS